MTTARRIDVIRAAMTVDDRLDDIKRAQIWAELEPRLGEPVPGRTRWPRALAAVAVVAAIVAVWLRPARPAARTLSAPADTTLAASLGPHTRAELVGPATLDVVGVPGDATSVRLHRGTLIAEFSGGAGRSLRIETGDAVIEIVGTLFSVEARETATCVSVAHGKVRVTSRAGEVAVATGQSWCSTRPQVEPLAPATHDRLARFEAVMVARAGTPAPAPFTAPAMAAPVALPATPAAVAAPAPAPVVRPSTPAVAPVHTVVTPATPAPVPTATPAPVPTVVAPRPVPHVDPVAPASPPAPHLDTAEGPAPASPEPAPSIRPPPPVAPVAPPAPPTPESLYEAAEAALGQGDTAGADRIFAQLLATFPHATLVDQALYERARIAYERHAWRDAQHHLDQLAAIASTPLAEPGAYLSCRIAIEAHDGAAEHCLLEYRKAYPSSPHDLDVLGVLTELAHEGGGCARARPRIDELVRAHPRSTLARAWAARCPEGR